MVSFDRSMLVGLAWLLWLSASMYDMTRTAVPAWRRPGNGRVPHVVPTRHTLALNSIESLDQGSHSALLGDFGVMVSFSVGNRRLVGHGPNDGGKKNQ
jgi:hypothetical protein